MGKLYFFVCFTWFKTYFESYFKMFTCFFILFRSIDFLGPSFYFKVNYSYVNFVPWTELMCLLERILLDWCRCSFKLGFWLLFYWIYCFNDIIDFVELSDFWELYYSVVVFVLLLVSLFWKNSFLFLFINWDKFFLLTTWKFPCSVLDLFNLASFYCS